MRAMKKRSRTILVVTLVFSLVLSGGLFRKTGAQAATDSIPSDAESYNGHLYKIYLGVVTWDEAKKACEDLGGHLATVTSAGENDFIGKMIGDGNTYHPGYWLGGYREKGVTDKWNWITGEDWGYSNWQGPNPTLGENELYLGMWTSRLSHQWNDFDYENLDYWIQGYVCEWESATPSPTASTDPSASPTPTAEPTVSPTPTVTPVVKKENPMTVTVNRIYGKAKHTVTVPRKKAFNIKNAKGTLSFKKISGSKRFTINKKTGDIRIEQHLKEGKKYFMVVQVTAAGNETYKSKSVKVQLRIKIH